MERPMIKCGDTEIPHNDLEWKIERYNKDEGSILGTHKPVTWKNGTSLGFEEATQVVQEHNEWLSKQGPDIEIVRLQLLLDDIILDLDKARDDVKHHEKRYYKVLSDLSYLRGWRDGTRKDCLRG